MKCQSYNNKFIFQNFNLKNWKSFASIAIEFSYTDTDTDTDKDLF